MVPLHSDALEAYLDSLAAAPAVDAVVEAMEQRARASDFPIVGRAVGRLLEQQARGIGARRVFEMGSGFGYSAYWFGRAVGPEGTVICTDRDDENAAAAAGHLAEAGLSERISFKVGDALNLLMAEDGRFDVIFCDADKFDYPECWRSAGERIRVGGLYICDNVLWSGRVADESDEDEATAAIREHNRLVMSDSRYVTTIVPLRDGVLVALRIV